MNDKYVEALVKQLVRDGINEGLNSFSLNIPSDYKGRVFQQRAEVVALIEGLGYKVTESGLPDDWSNGWELAPIRQMDPQGIPDDMVNNNKNRRLYKRGTVTPLNYKLWVSVK